MLTTQDWLERFEQLVRKRLTPVDASWRIESVNGVIRAMGPSASPFDNSVCWAEVDAGWSGTRTSGGCSVL